MTNEGRLSYNHTFYILQGIGILWKMEDVSAIIVLFIDLWADEFWAEEFCEKLRPPIRVLTAYIPRSPGVIMGALGSVGPFEPICVLASVARAGSKRRQRNLSCAFLFREIPDLKARVLGIGIVRKMKGVSVVVVLFIYFWAYGFYEQWRTPQL